MSDTALIALEYLNQIEETPTEKVILKLLDEETISIRFEHPKDENMADHIEETIETWLSNRTFETAEGVTVQLDAEQVFHSTTKDAHDWTYELQPTTVNTDANPAEA